MHRVWPFVHLLKPEIVLNSSNSPTPSTQLQREAWLQVLALPMASSITLNTDWCYADNGTAQGCKDYLGNACRKHSVVLETSIFVLIPPLLLLMVMMMLLYHQHPIIIIFYHHGLQLYY